MKSFLLLLTGGLFSMTVSAQANPSTGTVTRNRSAQLTDLIIKDSNGTVYPTNIAQTLLASGKYGLRPVSPNSNEMILYALSETERTRIESRSPKPKESNFFKEGDALTPFKERDMKGNKYNLKELQGKVVVLNFWFINCPPCRREIPELNEVVSKYKDNKDVVFLGIALDQKGELEDFLKTTPFDYNIVDNGRFTSQKYGVNLFPTHVVIDRQGKILFHTSGFSSSTVPWVKKSIEAGLNNTTVK